MADLEEDYDFAQDGETPPPQERPKGMLPRFVVVLTSIVLIIVLAASPMNQTWQPRPSLYKTLPFARIDYAVLAEALSRDGGTLTEVLLIAPEHANADDLEKLAQELKWGSPEGPRLTIVLFKDARAATLSGAYFDGKATPEERVVFNKGFIGTITRSRPGGPVTLEADLGSGTTFRRQY